MKVHTSTTVPNTGILIQSNEVIDIRRNRWIDKHNTSHPLKYTQPVAFENKNVYFLHLFGDDSGTQHKGVHISLSFWDNQKFLWLQKKQWFQNKDNVMWLVNIVVATLAIITTAKSLK
jgi:hypothetical protein